MTVNQNHIETRESTLREQLEHYFRFWYLFVLGVVVAMICAFLYLRYSTAQYQSKATVIIKDDKSGSGLELSSFAEMGGIFSKYSNSKIENELAIFKSKRIISEAIKALSLNIRYESIGTIKTTEIYERKPFTIQYLSFSDSAVTKSAPKLFVKIVSDSVYELENSSQTIKGVYNFGERVQLPFGDITILPVLDVPNVFNNYIGKLVSVTYSPIDIVASSYQRKVNVINDIKNSNVVNINILSPVTQKAEDFINQLIYQYNKDAINDNNQVAQKTSNFIDSRLEIITRELDSVERNKEQFKSKNRLTNIESEAQIILSDVSESNRRQLDVATQLELANTMIEYMEQSSENDLLPANIGLEGNEIAGSVKNYNDLILQRNRMLKNSTSKNPVVENVNNQIKEIRASILSGLQTTSNALKVSLRDLNYQEATLNSKISQVPTKEKIYRGIERQQNIKEQLYLFLLQQREEASISLAVTAPKAKVVDGAFSSRAPVIPNKPLVYLTGLIAGLLVPFLFVYGSILLNFKVANRKDVERVMANIPVIGEIPRLRKGDDELIQHNDRSVLAESFRILRTNLQYLFVNKLKTATGSHTIFVTSTVKGEGKTFIAFNLALTLALTGKKVVLVGADIRNPQLHRYLPEKYKSAKGLTEYIIDPEISVMDIALKSEYNPNLSILLSGEIPPNPAEVLLEQRTAEFFSQINEHFDYVIVDTAPAMLVTDTILINKYADILLYVIRAGFTDKRLLEFPADAIDDGRLSNVALALNSVSMNNFGYGNKYGYTYTNEKIPFYKRLFR